MTTIYNNPANIQIGQRFAGETGKTYADNRKGGGKKPFAVFDSPQMGIRAVARDLTTKIANHKGNIDSIIKQFAPKNENYTEQYSKYVKSQVGKDVATLEDLPNLVKAVIEYENSRLITDDRKLVDYYFQKEVFDEGIELSKYSFPSHFGLEDARKMYKLKQS